MNYGFRLPLKGLNEYLNMVNNKLLNCTELYKEQVCIKSDKSLH